MKKGFTVVELITSLSLVAIIAIFLTQIIINLNKMYQNSAIKTEVMNKQALISNYINKQLNEKEIASLSNCGTNCLKFNYTDSSSDEFKIDYNNNVLTFGSFKTNLPKNTSFKKVNFDVVYESSIREYGNNAILKITIPIFNDKLKKDNFDAVIYYQFDTRVINLTSFPF